MNPLNEVAFDKPLDLKSLDVSTEVTHPSVTLLDSFKNIITPEATFKNKEKTIRVVGAIIFTVGFGYYLLRKK